MDENQNQSEISSNNSYKPETNNKTPENQQNIIDSASIVVPVSKDFKYNLRHRILLFTSIPLLTLIEFIISHIFPSLSSFNYILFSLTTIPLLALSSLLYGYYYQSKFMQQVFFKRNFIKNLYLPLFSIIMSFLAVFIGNISGEVSYGYSAKQSPFWVALYIGFFMAAIIIYLSAVGNEIIIANKNRYKSFLWVYQVLYIFVWIVITILSFIFYLLIYSYNNPSAE